MTKKRDLPMTKKRDCPNCSAKVEDHPENGCVLAALIGVIRDRETVSERKLRELHANAHIDHIWDRLGPIIDGLEDGEFSPE